MELQPGLDQVFLKPFKANQHGMSHPQANLGPSCEMDLGCLRTVVSYSISSDASGQLRTFP